VPSLRRPPPSRSHLGIIGKRKRNQTKKKVYWIIKEVTSVLVLKPNPQVRKEGKCTQTVKARSKDSCWRRHETKGRNRKQEIKTKKVTPSSEQEESEVVERESEDEDEKRKASRSKKLSLDSSVSVVIELSSSAKRDEIPYYNSTGEEEMQGDEDEESQLQPISQSRLGQKSALMRTSPISIVHMDTKHINTQS